MNKKLRVLWFEVTTPKRFVQHGFQGGGWQDSLEDIVRGSGEVELGVAFESGEKGAVAARIEGVDYYPLSPQKGVFGKFKGFMSVDIGRDRLLADAKRVVEIFKPDIIHVFGSEWCFGQVANLTDVPVIIHMQGSIPPYNNAFYPPGYSLLHEMAFALRKCRLKSLVRCIMAKSMRESWKAQEENTLKIVKNYMGRTDWDRRIVQLFHPGAQYSYCGEALRTPFWSKTWNGQDARKTVLTSVGCSSFWKGLDTMIRTAKILRERGFLFEWRVVGEMGNKEFVEFMEGSTFLENNISLVGVANAESLADLLAETNIFVHPAYIDNSPNAICEAQLVGVPIVATNVGGIPSIVEDGVTGLLVPANDPFTMASKIMELVCDKEMSLRLSNSARSVARSRHAPSKILEDLLGIYRGAMRG